MLPNNKVMRLHAPRIENSDGLSRMVAEFELGEKKDELFFEVDEKFGSYLTPERSDAFVMIALIWALYDGFDIECEAPITDRLYYQLSEYLLPIICRYIGQYHRISIKGPVAQEVEPIEHGVVTGLSCGVDSFYSVLSHMDIPIESRRLTHLIMNNVGALTKKYDQSVEVFRKRKRIFSEIADDLGLEFVAVNTNIVKHLEGYSDYVNSPEPFKNAACAYALKRLFSCYYLAAGIDLDKFCFTWEDPAFYEPIVLVAMSGTFLPFYSTGAALKRGEKLECIVDEAIVQKNLNVCGDENDSSCSKCTRTLFELYALNRLEMYDRVFDIEYFKNNLADRIAFTVFDPNERMHGYCQETLKIAKRNKVRIPLKTYFLGIFKYAPLFFFKRKLGKWTRLKRFYHRHDLKTKLFNKGKAAW